jgi:hypothetical protein
MLAVRLPTVLPAMTFAEAIKTKRIHRVAGLTGGRTVSVTTRLCRGSLSYHLGCVTDSWRSCTDAGRGTASP